MELGPVDSDLPILPCGCASLRRASRAVTQLYDAELRATGLNTPQFTLLQVLDRVGRVGQGRLGRMLVLDSTTLSRTLRPLEKQRWILIRRGTDRRERQIELTAAGRSRLERATRAWDRGQRQLMARFGQRRWSALQSELARIAGLAATASRT
jgi:DNA-binding MarR family transcriptional regulator